MSVTMRWEKNTVVSEVAPFISSPLCPVSFIRIIQLVSSPCSFLCPFPHLPLGLLPLFSLADLSEGCLWTCATWSSHPLSPNSIHLPLFSNLYGRLISFFFPLLCSFMWTSGPHRWIPPFSQTLRRCKGIDLIKEQRWCWQFHLPVWFFHPLWL